MSDDKPKKMWVAESTKSYGASDMGEYDAIYRMARYYHGGVPETVKVVAWEVRGYHGGGHWQIDADEVLRETWFEIPRADFEALLDAAGAIDYAVEDALVDHEFDPRE